MASLFNTFLTNPLSNLLVFLYQNVTFQDLGLAIILLTIIIRLILYPLFYKSFRNQTLLQKLQPQIKQIQHDHKDNREQQAKVMLELYRQHKVNPFSGFLLILIQLPILIALYWVFLASPDNFNTLFLGLIDLSKRSILIVVLAAAFQHLQARMTLPKTTSGEGSSQMAQMTKTMVWIGPALTMVILYNLPAAVGLYWMTTSAFSMIQQLYINKKIYDSDNNPKTT